MKRFQSLREGSRGILRRLATNARPSADPATREPESEPPPAPPEIEATRPRFDAAFYLATYPDVADGGIDPLRHYHDAGWREHRDPSPDFSTRYYLEANPDVAASGANPFWHYLTQGEQEGRPATPLAALARTSALPPEVEATRPRFDAAFYLATYPDVADGGIDPLRHYHDAGWREHRDPSPDFSTRYYLEANPDVAASGANPFWHYLTQGEQEGRPATPLAALARTSALPPEIEATRPRFDAAFYLATYPDVADGGIDPLRHYHDAGWREHRDPSPDFSTRYYLEANPDVAASGANPFWHYLTQGEQEGRPATPLAALARTSALPPEIEATRPRFDAAFYLATYPDVADGGIDPLRHYHDAGWREHRDPSPDFSTRYYLEANPDVAASGANPFWHYLTQGEQEGRPATPLAALARTSALPPEIEATRPRFDAAFYLATYPDVADGGIDPLRHYHDAGWREHRDPSPDFSTRYYLEANPDVAASGANPFWHYLTQGEQEGRPATPLAALARTSALPPEIEATRPRFDAAFYLATYPDVADGGIDPLRHYHDAGWREHRDPSPDFSTRYYLEANPDVAASGANPFWHYLTQGEQEGRPAMPPTWNAVDVLEALVPFEEQVRNWRHRSPPEELMDADALAPLLLQNVSDGCADLVLSVSHDHPRHLGGVQVSVRHEELVSVGYGRSYLHLHPWQPLPRLAHEDEDPDPLVAVVFEGETVGACHTSTVVTAVSMARPSLREVSVVIHHLMGHSPERLADLVVAANGGQCHLWTHDFFTLSPSFTLQRNGVAFCGAPDRHSNACMLCVYGEERQPHLDRLGAFFDRLSVHVLSPSQVTADFWRSRTSLRHQSLTVAPLQSLDWLDRPEPLPVKDDRVVTVGYVGLPSPIKGWPVFEAIVRHFGQSDQYRFVYFGLRRSPLKGVEHVPVQVTGDQLDIMIDALRTAEVDLVLNWPSWFETFSISAHEAIAAGAFVLTHDGSGNVANVVRQTGHGLVLPDRASLVRLFSGPEAAELARRARQHRAAHEGRLSPSSVTHSFLAKPVRQNEGAE